MDGEAIQVEFFCSSHTLQTSFEIRYRFTPTQWDATVHPMDGASWRINGCMQTTFAEFFSDLLTGIDRGDLISLPAGD